MVNGSYYSDYATIDYLIALGPIDNNTLIMLYWSLSPTSFLKCPIKTAKFEKR